MEDRNRIRHTFEEGTELTEAERANVERRLEAEKRALYPDTRIPWELRLDNLTKDQVVINEN